MWILSMSPEYPGEKETGAHSSILAWRIPGTSEPPWGHKRVRHDLAMKQQQIYFRCNLSTSFVCMDVRVGL